MFQSPRNTDQSTTANLVCVERAYYAKRRVAAATWAARWPTIAKQLKVLRASAH